MKERSVRFNDGSLALAESVFSAHHTSLSQYLREVVDYVGRSGELISIPPTVPHDDNLMMEKMLSFESMAAQLTRVSDWPQASDDDLLADELVTRFGYGE